MVEEGLIDGLQGAFQLLQQKLLLWLPNLVLSVLILLIGFVAAGALRYLVKRLVVASYGVATRMGWRGTPDPDDNLSASFWLGNAVFFSTLLVTFTLLAEFLGLKVLSNWLSGMTTYVPKLIAALLMAFLGYVLARVLRDMVLRTLKSASLAQTEVFGRLVYAAVLVATVLVSLTQLGIEVEFVSFSLLTLLGACLFGGALAFGIGSNSVVSDILASYYLQKTYRVGERVRIGDAEGKILKITSTAVILDGAEGRVTIPAKKFGELISVALRADR